MRWSDSLDMLFRTCQRKYYLAHIVASPTTNDPKRQRAFRLKNLSDLNRWKGNLIHKALELFIIPQAILSDRLDFNSIKYDTFKLMEDQFTFSKNREFEYTTKTDGDKRYCALQIHYEDGDSDQDTKDQIWDDISKSIDKFASQQKLINSIHRGNGHRWEHTLRFPVRDIKVETRPDFWFWTSEGELILIDWKQYLLPPGNAKEQLTLYAYAIKKSDWQLDQNLTEDQIHPYEVNLHNEQAEVAYAYHLSKTDLQEVEDRIFLSAQSIRSVVKNRTYDELDINDFLPARSQGSCDYCSLRPLCRELSYAKPRTDNEQLPLFVS